MKLIIAIIKPFKLDEVREALSRDRRAGHDGLRGQGFGRQKGQTEIYRGAEYTTNLVPKVKIEIVASDASRRASSRRSSRPPAPARSATARSSSSTSSRRPHPHRRTDDARFEKG
jgi:hypothetical protein